MKWKIIALIGAALAGATGLTGFFWPPERRASELRLPGVVEIQEIKLGSKAGGRVKGVFVREGDLVHPGTILVTFEAPELEAQRSQLQARQRAAAADLERANNGPRYQELEAAREAVESARARWRRLQAGSRPEEVRQARGELESAEADLAAAQSELSRQKRMLPERASSQNEHDQALAGRDRAQGKVRGARAHLDLLLAGARQEEIDEATAEMKRLQASYDLLRAGTRAEEIAAAEARLLEVRGKVREMDAQLAETVVRAPDHAVVEVLAVRPGDLVQPSQVVLHVLRTADVWIKVYVPETDLARVRLGQDAEVRVDAYPDRRFAGRVEQIASASEFTPRNMQSASERRHQVFGVKVRVDNPEGVFKSGLSVEVILPPGE